MSDIPDLPDPPELTSSLGEAIAADAAVAHAAEHTGHGGPLHTHCENCGAKLEGPYCHRCGQHDFDIHRSFGHVFLEVLESFFHFDAKFFQNIVVLLFQPGRLTAAFNGGKRASQMPPFRLYVFVSILFFFLTFLGMDHADPVVIDSDGSSVHAKVTFDDQSAPTDEAPGATEQRPGEAAREPGRDAGQEAGREAAAAAKTSLDEVVKVAGQHGNEAAQTTKKAVEKLIEDVKAAQNKKPHTKEPGFFDGFIGAINSGHGAEMKPHLVHNFLVAIPKLILLCLPFFALFTRVLFRKSSEVYLQHLVLAVHFHTFIFLWSMVTDGWTFLLGFASHGVATLVTVGASLWLVIYPLLMLKHLFGNSWLRTIVKTGLLAVAYFTTLAMGFAVIAIIAIALI